VLDAQYFGVPQRRRRVFLVGHSSGDSRRAAKVLFEPESLRGHSPQSKRTGEEVAQCLTAGTGICYDPHTETLIPVESINMYQNNQTDARLKKEPKTSQTVLASMGTGGGNTPLVSHAFPINTMALGGRPNPINDRRMMFGVGDNENPSYLRYKLTIVMQLHTQCVQPTLPPTG